jgi:tRNA pseudouridine55 synthase
MNGFLNLNKPSGMTSRRVVDRVARLVRGVKVGHAGTLDPLATGVLVIGLGAATRLIERVQRMPKTYRAVVRLGARSNTLDADGEVVAMEDPTIPSRSDIQRFLATQVGEIRQLPPAFSALWVKGQRAYELARAGEPVDLKTRTVRIDRVELVDYRWPELVLEIDCGAGTYIRSIARDLGESLGCGGLIQELVRTRTGPFSVADAVDPDDLTFDSLPHRLRPLREAVYSMPTSALDEEQVALVTHGRTLDAHRLAVAASDEGEVALVDSMGRLVALARVDMSQQSVRPFKVLT